MKLMKVVSAKEALKRLTASHFSNYKILRKLVQLRKAVDAEVEFYAEAEKRAVEQFAEKDGNGNPIFLSDGRLKLKSPADKIAFESEITKLGETAVEGIEPVLIHEADFLSSSELPTPEDILLLDGIIVFEE